MSYFEKNAIISGLGISRIGRRTGIPGAELTLEAARAAIDDAGLTADDIDGIATFGDTPLTEVADTLGIQPTDVSLGFDTGGVLMPVMSAFRAVAERTGATRAGLSDGRDAGRVDDRRSRHRRCSTRWPPRRSSRTSPEREGSSNRSRTSTSWWPRTPTRPRTGWRCTAGATWSSMERPKSSWAGWRSTAGATPGSTRVPRTGSR